MAKVFFLTLKPQNILCTPDMMWCMLHFHRFSHDFTIVTIRAINSFLSILFRFCLGSSLQAISTITVAALTIIILKVYCFSTYFATLDCIIKVLDNIYTCQLLIYGVIFNSYLNCNREQEASYCLVKFSVIVFWYLILLI